MGSPICARRKRADCRRPSFVDRGHYAVQVFQRISFSSWQVPTMGLICSEDAGDGDDLTAGVDADLAGDMEKECSTTGVFGCLAGAPVD